MSAFRVCFLLGPQLFLLCLLAWPVCSGLTKSQEQMAGGILQVHKTPLQNNKNKLKSTNVEHFKTQEYL